FMSSHRFADPGTGRATLLPVGAITDGHGYRLAGRICREIVAGHPKEVGGSMEKVGRPRAQAKASD
ncbi:hypothetical protein DICSQDRAFT_16817, partial [Dichomitus squalens LYAD-421 SS1]